MFPRTWKAYLPAASAARVARIARDRKRVLDDLAFTLVTLAAIVWLKVVPLQPWMG